MKGHSSTVRSVEAVEGRALDGAIVVETGLRLICSLINKWLTHRSAKFSAVRLLGLLMVVNRPSQVRSGVALGHLNAGL